MTGSREKDEDGRARTAAVVLAQDADDGDVSTVARLAAAARAAGCDPIVVVLPRGLAAPAGTRGVAVAVGATRISALRMGMAQLGNSPVEYALLLSHAGDVEGEALGTLLSAVAATRPPLAALEGADIERDPLLAARATWLELMTVGEQGLGAVAARHTVLRVAR